MLNLKRKNLCKRKIKMNEHKIKITDGSIRITAEERVYLRCIIYLLKNLGKILELDNPSMVEIIEAVRELKENQN